MVETGATVADAADEWLRWAEHDRDCKPSTLADYRSTSRLIVRALGELRLEDVTPQLLERWKTTIAGSNRNVQKRLVVLHGIFRRAIRVWGLPRNPVADVERPRVDQWCRRTWIASLRSLLSCSLGCELFSLVLSSLAFASRRLREHAER